MTINFYKKLLLFLILYQGVYAESYAQGIVGTSPLSLFHPDFKCSSLLNIAHRRKDFAIATLYKTFGTSTKCFERVSLIRKRITRKHYNRRGKVRSKTLRSVVEIHLLNGAGRRNKRLAQPEFRPKTSSKRFCSSIRKQDPALLYSLERYLISVKNLINKHPHLEWLISPELESNCSNTQGKTLLGIVQQWAINNLIEGIKYSWVWNPLKEKRIEGAYHELHGFNWPIAPCIYNFDGLDIKIEGRNPLSNNISIHDAKWIIKEQKRRCDFVFIWTKEMNGISSDKFISPRLRKDYSIPSSIDLLLK